MRLAAFYVSDIVNSHYRAVVPMRELERRGHDVLWSLGFTFGSTIKELPVCELALIHRCMGERDLELVRRLQQRGIAVVWDNDDDISELPRMTRREQGVSKRHARRTFARTIEIAQTADLMTTPSEHLAATYRAAGVEQVAVIENHVAAAEVGRRRERHAGVVIGCTAGGEHATDLKRLRIAATLEAILQAHPGARVVALGVDLKLSSPRYAHRRWVAVEELVAFERQFDIGIAPIEDTPFNRARSNVKLREYAAAGAMWLASPYGPYTGMGERQGGLLVADRDWYAALDALLADYRRRAELTERARAWAREDSMGQAVRTWEDAFKAAIRRARGRR